MLYQLLCLCQQGQDIPYVAARKFLAAARHYIGQKNVSACAKEILGSIMI